MSSDSVSPELIAIITASILLCGLILRGQYITRRELGTLREDVVKVRERITRLEGIREQEVLTTIDRALNISGIIKENE